MLLIFFFSSRRRHTRFLPVSWARRCVQETGHNIKHEEIENPALQEEVREQGQGSFILCVVKEKGENMQQQKIMDCIVCQGFKTSVCIMCSKEDLHSFRIRYGDSA
eukprot:TRINITY_DN1631_c0_g1_i10.p2 TRINITY_DN1631_c0_g1~~TRINITY_DN1631_c0_g1_i10.p2  ORF type:complete len:106 (-),score=44.70 TRINITY_DN1631_c0_g1_i10:113-430(-)